jgi:Holliday junction resolvase RusA-like endonuclease
MTDKSISFTAYGEPASKANSRKIVKFGDRPAIIKSKKARGYETDFAPQCPQLEPPITCDVRVFIKIYYASRRPDLDESVILDCMQTATKLVKMPDGTKERKVLRNNIYKNDRQVKEKHIFWALDKENPRAEITVEPLDSYGWVTQ